ncbi:hypothetical protein IFM89_003319 [Coptis chinensis]|uniref:Uncharacterized protein n=1 Tax=Coptis chinensis TaxID=261450 RepID=A0A835MDX6_9MAGN|nr:hypothetical protein IFM89_003319 [Coptis chinensis]
MTRTLKRGSYRLQANTSYPFFAEASFRQLDDVFLQTQTRIWLGEVLKTRLDEEISVTDLLADGILLFEVSKVMWKMLLTKFMKLGSSKAFFSKSVGHLGRVLGGTCLTLMFTRFSRVCLCIRYLSKKARSKDLNVPDFDVVTYTVAMPKDMVKGICNSLVQSQCRSSVNSAGCSTYILSIPKYGQRYWAFDNGRHYDSCSEESDSTDSNYQVFGYYIPASTISCGGASLYSDAESST